MAFVLAGAVWFVPPQAAAQSAACFGRLGQILVEGAYSGGLNCAEVTPSISSVGEIRRGRHRFAVYDLRYKLKPTPGGAIHGGQRVLFLMDDKKYVGQYALSPPPFLNLRVDKHGVNIGVRPSMGAEIFVGGSGPSGRAYLDGSVSALFR